MDEKIGEKSRKLETEKYELEANYRSEKQQLRVYKIWPLKIGRESCIILI